MAELHDDVARNTRHAARSGVALLSGPFVARLRAEEFQRRIASVDDLPQLL